MKLSSLLMAMCVFASPAAFAQLQPQGAHVALFFPQLADGGNQSEKWQTSFIFVNASATTASVQLYITSNSGAPMSLDLGSGSSTRHDFSIPSRGSRTLRSRMVSGVTITGWATAYSSTPLQGTVLYRQFVNGVAKQEIAAQATLPTILYTSPANRYLGVALANVYSYPINADLTFYNSEGVQAGGPVRMTIPALGHNAFILSEKFPNIGDGMIQISAIDPPSQNDFVAWTLGADASGIWSSLPPGASAWPISHYDRIWLVFQDVVNAAMKMGAITSQPRLDITYGKEINARAINGNTVLVTIGLSELISDSASELAFAVAHEIGHIYQQRTGRFDFRSNPEHDADVWGAALALGAGYDPYGAAGALAKFAMASGTAGLITQFEDQFTDIHTSFNTRLQLIFEAFRTACNSSADIKSQCNKYRSLVHPHIPDTAPLAPMVKH